MEKGFNKKKPIVIIDNNKEDAFLASNIFESLFLNNRIQIFDNAVQALEYFRLIEDEPAFYNLFAPEIILVNINIPGKGGFEFLDEFNRFKVFKNKPLKILITSSNCETQEIKRVKNYTYNCTFIPKPLNKEAVKNSFFFNTINKT